MITNFQDLSSGLPRRHLPVPAERPVSRLQVHFCRQIQKLGDIRLGNIGDTLYFLFLPKVLRVIQGQQTVPVIFLADGINHQSAARFQVGQGFDDR